MQERIISKRLKDKQEDDHEKKMKAARKAERLDEENKIVITILSDIRNPSEETITYNYSQDISMTGTRIQGNVLLPVDTLLQIDLTLKNLKQTITARGKVKWSKPVSEGKYFESGVEFVDTPEESIKILGDYIASINQYKNLNPMGMPYWIFQKFNKPKV